MAFADRSSRIITQGLGAVALTPLISLFFMQRSSRKSEKQGDSWGLWGLVFVLAVTGLGGFLFAAVGGLLVMGAISSPWNYLIVSVPGGLSLLFAFLVYWSYKVHRQGILDTSRGAEDVTEAPEDVTEAPEDVTEALVRAR